MCHFRGKIEEFRANPPRIVRHTHFQLKKSDVYLHSLAHGSCLRSRKILSLGGGKSIYGEKFEDDAWWIQGVETVDDFGVMIRFSIVDFPWPPKKGVFFFDEL